MLKISTKPASLRPRKLAAPVGFTLCILGALAAGCGDDTGGGGGGSGSTGSSGSTAATSGSTSKSSSSASGSSGSSSSASSSSGGTTSHKVTFTVDTTSKADGAKLLAEVKADEKVFLVGAFNNWNPQDPLYAMTPVAGQPGKFTITLTFPGDYPGGMLDTGASFEYKFAKTTDKPGDPPAGDPWGNGVKDYFKIDATHPTCPDAPGE